MDSLLQTRPKKREKQTYKANFQGLDDISSTVLKIGKELNKQVKVHRIIAKRITRRGNRPDVTIPRVLRVLGAVNDSQNPNILTSNIPDSNGPDSFLIDISKIITGNETGPKRENPALTEWRYYANIIEKENVLVSQNSIFTRKMLKNTITGILIASTSFGLVYLGYMTMTGSLLSILTQSGFSQETSVAVNDYFKNNMISFAVTCVTFVLPSIALLSQGNILEMNALLLNTLAGKANAPNSIITTFAYGLSGESLLFRTLTTASLQLSSKMLYTAAEFISYKNFDDAILEEFVAQKLQKERDIDKYLNIYRKDPEYLVKIDQDTRFFTKNNFKQLIPKLMKIAPYAAFGLMGIYCLSGSLSYILEIFANYSTFSDLVKNYSGADVSIGNLILSQLFPYIKAAAVSYLLPLIGNLLIKYSRIPQLVDKLLKRIIPARIRIRDLPFVNRIRGILSRLIGREIAWEISVNYAINTLFTTSILSGIAPLVKKNIESIRYKNVKNLYDRLDSDNILLASERFTQSLYTAISTGNISEFDTNFIFDTFFSTVKTVKEGDVLIDENGAVKYIVQSLNNGILLSVRDPDNNLINLSLLDESVNNLFIEIDKKRIPIDLSLSENQIFEYYSGIEILDKDILSRALNNNTLSQTQYSDFIKFLKNGGEIKSKLLKEVDRLQDFETRSDLSISSLKTKITYLNSIVLDKNYSKSQLTSLGSLLESDYIGLSEAELGPALFSLRESYEKLTANLNKLYFPGLWGLNEENNQIWNDIINSNNLTKEFANDLLQENYNVKNQILETINKLNGKLTEMDDEIKNKARDFLERVANATEKNTVLEYVPTENIQLEQSIEQNIKTSKIAFVEETMPGQLNKQISASLHTSQVNTLKTNIEMAKTRVQTEQIQKMVEKLSTNLDILNYLSISTLLKLNTLFGGLGDGAAIDTSGMSVSLESLENSLNDAVGSVEKISENLGKISNKCFSDENEFDLTGGKPLNDDFSSCYFESITGLFINKGFGQIFDAIFSAGSLLTGGVFTKLVSFGTKFSLSFFASRGGFYLEKLEEINKKEIVQEQDIIQLYQNNQELNVQEMNSVSTLLTYKSLRILFTLFCAYSSATNISSWLTCPQVKVSSKISVKHFIQRHGYNSLEKIIELRKTFDDMLSGDVGKTRDFLISLSDTLLDKKFQNLYGEIIFGSDESSTLVNEWNDWKVTADIYSNMKTNEAYDQVTDYKTRLPGMFVTSISGGLLNY